jgi:hypothetical protein
MFCHGVTFAGGILHFLSQGHAIYTLPWIQLDNQHSPDPYCQSVSPYALAIFNWAVQDLEGLWEVQGGDLSDPGDQNTVTTIMKAAAHRRFLDTCSLDSRWRQKQEYQTI